jgi:hypothetical protein
MGSPLFTNVLCDFYTHNLSYVDTRYDIMKVIPLQFVGTQIYRLDNAVHPVSCSLTSFSVGVGNVLEGRSAHI